MPRKLRLVVCQTLLREVEASVVGLDLDRVTIAQMTMACALPPARREGIAREAADGASQDTDVRVLGGCSSLPASVDAAPSIPISTCHEMVAGRSLVEHLIAEGAYLITPGWLEHWPDHMVRQGLDQASARELYGETVKRLVLLDTGVVSNSNELLQAFADHLGLEHLTLGVGLDHLSLYLAKLIQQWRAGIGSAAEDAALARARRESADYLMVFDMLETLASIGEEQKVSSRLMELCAALFAPRAVVLLSVVDGRVGRVVAQPTPAVFDEEAVQRFLLSGDDHRSFPTHTGFLVRLAHAGITVGVILVDGLQFPEHHDRYLRVASAAAQVGALSIANARAYSSLADTVEQLSAAMADVKLLRGLIPICSYCKQIRDDQGYWKAVEHYIGRAPEAQFTHGICPSCFDKNFPKT